MVRLPRTCDRKLPHLAALLICACAAPAAARLHQPPSARVTAVRVLAANGGTRVAIHVAGRYTVKYDRLDNPDRLFFDLVGADSAIVGKGMHTFPVRDPLVKQIRVAETQHGITRVVLDLKKPARFTTTRLASPGRLLIDLHEMGQAASTPLREDAPPAVAATLAPRRFLAPSQTHVLSEIHLADPPELDTWDLDLDSAAMYNTATRGRFGFLLFTPRPAGKPPKSAALARSVRPALSPRAAHADEDTSPASDRPLAGASAARSNRSTLAAQSGQADEEAVARPAPASAAEAESAKPARRAADEQSMTRVLGLKIRRVVIDAGHGGHDTGTIGASGLLEKDLVLDVALRLGKLVEQRLGAEVVYTRSDDTFIPLEERTRIANDSRADLFLSVHANSSPQRSASGIETYYLNFTTSQSAMDVAARENASSDKTVYELKDLLQKIALQDKIEESREFAAAVQRSLYAASVRLDSRSKDRGVRKAPFVVLIGASMPSVLAEIGFISNPHDAAALRRGENRQRIAEALFKGVANYSNSLSHFTIASRDTN